MDKPIQNFQEHSAQHRAVHPSFSFDRVLPVVRKIDHPEGAPRQI
jgi:hypothetical protein